MNKRIGLCLVILWWSVGLVMAQVAPTKLPLATALENLAQQASINFNYDPDLVAAFEAPRREAGEAVTTYLERLQAKLPFSFERVAEGYYLVTPQPVSFVLTVVDTQDGLPMPGVYVRKGEKYFEKTTDINGEIELSFAWSAQDTLYLSFVGYREAALPVLTYLAEPIGTLAMQEDITLLPDLTITGYLAQGISAYQRDHSLRIQNGEMGILPGEVDKDVLLSLRTLPGIQTVTGRAGELRVRGGTPDQLLIRYNNIPILHKGYYFGTISPFNTDVVETIRVFRSGFGPQLGGRVGGAVEMETSNTLPEALQLGVATNSYAVSSYLKAPIVPGKLGGYLAVRSDYPGDYISPIEREYQQLVAHGTFLAANAQRPGFRFRPIEFNFWDANGALSYVAGPKTRLSAHFLTINNDNFLQFNDSLSRSQGTRDYTLSNTGGSVEWDQQGATWQGHTSVAFSNYDFLIDVRSDTMGVGPRRQAQQNQVRTTEVRSEWSRSLGIVGSELKVGYNYERYQSLLGRTAGPGAWQYQDQLGTSHSLYASYFLPDWNNVMLDVGVRTTYFPVQNKFRVEPRIFANYFLSDRWTLKSSFGTYSQMLSRTVFFDHSELLTQKLNWVIVGVPGGINIPDGTGYTTSWQALAGFSYQGQNWLFDVEGYYKEVDNLATPSYLEGQMGVGPGVYFGSLTSRGVDVLLRGRYGNFNTWSTYTLSKTDMNFRLLAIGDFPANYDQRHVVNLGVSYQHKGWRATLGWLFATGVPDYTRYSPFPSQGDTEPIMPVPVPTITRFLPINQLDASVAYVLDRGPLRTTFGLSVLNLYDRDNLLEFVPVTIDTPNGGTRDALTHRLTIGFAPNFMIKLEYNRKKQGSR